ncbi:xanthine dehydrogenase accessory protein XdhC [Ornithinimicrobium cryptoxanthini]|uniref:Xanthine dehydrogenase accessory protein XdhC n=1 Tax=Ornithinimicrobium cryptoxanthini TaxID=2934161 RepID=A0ABY4YKF1_9MICO|nr:xanthine dehydrogenase accessory protein XdhC [Ornithinimicrobium cryptoxanthini]USQ77102.1 xanthine dehydrogenase accessory protein XdhC [Ornithinimicrobium cryptoxanthini]
MDWLRALTHLRDEGRSGVLLTVTSVRGHAPREAGAKMVVTPGQTWGSIGGGNLEATAVTRARELLAAGTTAPVTLDLSLHEHAPVSFGRQCCGGEVSLLLEPLPARPVVAVFGLGHVGQELGRILGRLPLAVHLVDSRTSAVHQMQAAVSTDGPADVRITHAPAPEVVLADLPAHAHVLVMTHDHAEDLVLCEAALRRGDLGSVGVIGSSAKWQRFRKRLLEAGHTEASIGTLTSPIGRPELVGKEPAVIAVSVAAELLRALRAEPVSGLTPKEGSELSSSPTG